MLREPCKACIRAIFGGQIQENLVIGNISM